MKILIALILTFAVWSEISAQPIAKTSEPLSPALQEAAKLSGNVVKLFGQNKFDEALPLAQKVIEIRERESGKTHLSVGQARRNLAYIQQRLGKTDEAEKTFEKALEIYELNQPLAAADEKVFAELLDVVAVYQANDGKFDNAEKTFQRALELQEKIHGKDALQTSDALTKLGQIHSLKGEYDSAVPVFLRALDIRAAKLGATNDETRDVYNNAYCALTKLGDEQQAKQLSEKFDPPKPKSQIPADRKLPVFIEGGIVNAKALSLAKPRYPLEARNVRASGSVTVRVTIDEQGRIIFACALTGARVLHRASEIAAYQSTFAPTTLEGKPVRVTGVIVYNFVYGGR